MTNFLDYFSQQAVDYAKYRPQYPAALFEYLLSAVDKTELAWDCGCGNGQAAVSLKAYFAEVIATDPSESQISNAMKKEGVIYRVEPAEKTTIKSKSIDLVTVAQALHWFNREAFYEEVKRVLKPSGVIAVWCYGLMDIQPEIDKLIVEYHDNIVGQYWPSERQLIGEKYYTIPFPFKEFHPPKFQIEVNWSLKHLLAYLETWSATQKYITANNSNPLDKIKPDLIKVWGEATDYKMVRSPLYLRVGRL